MVALSSIPRRTLVATTVIVVGWLIYSIWTTLAGASKFPAEARLPGAVRMNAEVVLRFPPELFHIQILQDAGRMTQVVGRSVFLMDANVGALQSIARRTW